VIQNLKLVWRKAQQTNFVVKQVLQRYKNLTQDQTEDWKIVGNYYQFFVK